MAYSKEVLHRARQRLEGKLHAAERHTELVYNKYPRLREIDEELRKTAAQIAAAAFARGETEKAAAEIRNANLALQRERKDILRANGLAEDDLEPRSVCPDCGGSGYAHGAMCRCLKELCREEQKKELSRLLDGQESFDGFRLEYYPAEGEGFAVSPRRLMSKVLLRCRDYADTFSVRSPSLLFSGGTGLGKTFLSACIARQVAEMGFSVVYESVVTMLDEFEKEKFSYGESANLTEKYLACDLLIADDLGTELLTPFAQSALYRVINTRIVRRLPTVISTNLTPGELSSTYLPQTASRLLGTYELLQFFGNDIRMMKE